jgi:hypothetical protein
MTDKSLGTFINPFVNSNLRKIYAEANFELNERAVTRNVDDFKTPPVEIMNPYLTPAINLPAK